MVVIGRFVLFSFFLLPSGFDSAGGFRWSDSPWAGGCRLFFSELDCGDIMDDLPVVMIRWDIEPGEAWMDGRDIVMFRFV